MNRYDQERYNNLTVKQYIEIKLEMIKEAKKNPINNAFGNMQVLLTIEKMFNGDLEELRRHTIVRKEDLV